MTWRGLAGLSIVGALLVTVLLPRGGVAGTAPLRVAVMEFTNAAPAGDLATLGKGLQSMITTDLAGVPSLQLIERARLSDVVGELKLGRSGLVEAGTASRVGKLAGATHLLAGSFTVVGARMRLDGRLFAVESGTTLLAESIEGERDAFFELEKSLVAKIVDKLGVKLQPKERAALARPHTTDFEAFQSFSNGVALFDEKKYDEAVTALRAAAGRDADFKLAIVTLAEYQRVIAEVRSRADELQVSQQQLAALERQKSAQGETEMLKRLFELASRKGADATERLAARRAIAEAYGNTSSDYHVLELQSFEDRFALQRTADAFTQSYYAEALSLFPRYPLVIRGESWFPKTIAEYDKWWRTQLDSLECRAGDCNHQRVEDLKWWGNMPRPVDFFGRRLHLDARGEAELHDRLYKLALQVGAGPDFRIQALARLANDYRNAGDLARSTRAFTELAGILREPREVRKVADQIEVNRKATDALEHSPNRELLREAFILGPQAAAARPLADLVEPRFVDLFASKPPAPTALAALASFRMFPQGGNDGSWRSERYVWIDDQPVWLLQQRSYNDMTFAPRSDRYRAAEIRHFVTADNFNHEPSLKGIDSLLIVEGVPRSHVGLRFTVDFTPAADWWPPLVDAYTRTRSVTELVKLDGRPEVGVLFALEDVDCMTFDPKAHTIGPGRPLRGYMLTIDETAVRLSAIGTDKPPRWEIDRPGLNLTKAIARQPVGDVAMDLRGAKRLDVTASITGRSIQATVNGRHVSFTIPAPAPAGFYGLQFRGAGYAAIKSLKVTHSR